MATPRVYLTGKGGFVGTHLRQIPDLVTDDIDYDVIIHAGASTDVNESLEEPEMFINGNVESTTAVLELARAANVPIWLISTAEVYGPSATPLPHGSPFLPSNPYAGSKAACEMVAISYARTFGVDLHIINTMHLFGQGELERKFIPATVRRLLAGEPAVVFGDSTRHWLHVDDFCQELWQRIVLRSSRPREDPGSYLRAHLIGHQMSCLALGKMVAEKIGVEFEYESSDFHLNPGHTAHYSIVSDMDYPFWTLEKRIGETVVALLAAREPSAV